jgi:2-haloacid dehalogenase
MREIKALTFDTGGTILDWHQGISHAFAEVGQRHNLSADWHTLTNDYRRRSLQTMLSALAPRFNIDEVHRHTLDLVLKENGLDQFTAEDRDYIWRTWHNLKAWPDFPQAARRLRQKYLVVSFTILSTSLVIDVSRKNGLEWDCIINGEMLGIYKIQPEAYRSVARLLALPPESILMVACHNFDLMAAREQGYKSAFVHRPDEWGPSGPPDPVPNPAHDYAVQTFDELATRLGC